MVHKTYEHILQTNSFDCLRSTRHFGAMVFHCCVIDSIDELLSDMIRRDLLKDAQHLIVLSNLVKGNQISEQIEQTDPIDYIKV